MRRPRGSGTERVEVTGAGRRGRGRSASRPSRPCTGSCGAPSATAGSSASRVAADGPELRVSPVTEAAAPIVTAQDLRDLGAAVGVRVVDALGGSAELEAEDARGAAAALRVLASELARSIAATTSSSAPVPRASTRRWLPSARSAS